MPAGKARVRITFSLDADGLLTVEAREELTGISQQVEVKPSYGLSEADLETMLTASFKHAKQDIENRLLVETRLNAQKMLKTLSSALEEDGHLVSKEQATVLSSTMETLEIRLKENNRQALEETLDILQKLVQPFIEGRLNHSLETIQGQKIEKIEQNLQKR